MPGRRQKDFRGGDLSEELGILLLKSFSAVAAVSRTEDFGLDAIATLLNPNHSEYFVAEDSFFVQIKSSSRRKIKYKEHEVRWIENLKLPLFIGNVLKEQGSIELFATHKLSQTILEQEYSEITLLLNPKGEFRTDNACGIFIGPPLLRWAIRDIANSDFRSRAYTIMKAYISVEQRNIDNRSIRYFETINWTTDSVSDGTPLPGMYQSVSTQDIINVFKSMSPHLLAISLNTSLKQDEAGFKTLIQMIEYMRRNGYDPDPFGQYQAVYQYFSLKMQEMTKEDKQQSQSEQS